MDTAVQAAPTGARLLTLRANLLPAEVIARRQVRRIRVVVLIALALVVLLLLAWYGVGAFRKLRADYQLTAAQEQANTLRTQQGRYRELIEAQTKSTAIKKQLATLMATDVTWSSFSSSLRTAAPAGIGLTSVALSLADAGQGAGQQSSTASGLPSTGGTPIGTVTITGTGSSRYLIANYAEKVATLKGVGTALLTSASKQDSGITFTIVADLSPVLVSHLHTTN